MRGFFGTSFLPNGMTTKARRLNQGEFVVMVKLHRQHLTDAATTCYEKLLYVKALDPTSSGLCDHRIGVQDEYLETNSVHIDLGIVNYASLGRRARLDQGEVDLVGTVQTHR